MSKKKIILLGSILLVGWSVLIGKIAWDYQPVTGNAMCPGLGSVPFVGEPKFDGPWVEMISAVDGTHVKLSNCIGVVWDKKDK